MKKTNLFKIFVFAMVLSLLGTTTAFAVEPTIKPDLVLTSDITVQVSYVNTMPFVANGPGIVPGTFGSNLGSPVPIGNILYLIDQNDAIYRANGNGNIKKVFDVSEAPDGLALDHRQSILNISRGRFANSLYVMFTSGTEPTTGIPNYPMPAQLPGVCCIPVPGFEIPIADLYRIGQVPAPLDFFGVTRTEYQVLYEYRLSGNKLKNPRAIASFETQSGPTHNGGGMLTLPDGRVLFATADALPFGADGRAAPQDPSEVVSKLLIIDPNDGSIEVAAQGIRNVQHMQFFKDKLSKEFYLAFGDIGGVTAEEVNFVSVSDLLDTSTIENFGWGRNPDGIAREGVFYIQSGVPMVSDTDPPVDSFAPSPEPGFIQPHSQYGRHDPNGGVAVTGPVISRESFKTITALFSDLASGVVYATQGSVNDVNAPVFKVNLVDENGTPLDSLQDLAGGRADPRFFLFPNGEAGVLLEATGAFYRLTEVSGN